MTTTSQYFILLPLLMLLYPTKYNPCHNYVLIEAMQIHRTWSTKHWCSIVSSPHWPFAYSKYKDQKNKEETKGRTSTNQQDMRHECDYRGVESKCHICKDIRCGVDGTEICHYQLQGVKWADMSTNIPTISDVPWAVGGKFRYDFGGGGTSHVCMYMSSSLGRKGENEEDEEDGLCQSSFHEDYSNCILRCWGYDDYIDDDDDEKKENKSHYVNSPKAATSLTPFSNLTKQDGDVLWPNDRYDNVYGVNSTPWTIKLPTATWSYPKFSSTDFPRNPFSVAAATGAIDVKDKASTNLLKRQSQGFTFTVAGSKDGEAGFADGHVVSEARFRYPEGVAVDHEGYVYVADTGNHAIRVISPITGTVTTLAGVSGSPGNRDGPAKDAKFTDPSDLAVWRDWQWWPYVNPIDPDSFLYENGNGRIVLFVADTGNHRIRKITADVTFNNDTNEKIWSNVIVSCFSGRCSSSCSDSSNAEGGSHTDSDQSKANSDSSFSCFPPEAGYADGEAHMARFDSPRGVAVTSSGNVVVADTNNHLIRIIDKHGFTRTLAGSTTIAERNVNGEKLEGCPDPCLKGVAGANDGLWNASKFSFPSGVAVARKTKENGYGSDDHAEEEEEAYVYVTDRHHLRRISLRHPWHKVTTLAGGKYEGERDDLGTKSTFHKPDSVTVTSDGIAYVTDAASCRIRRVSPTPLIASKSLTSCYDTLSHIMRPSGCSSYNPPIDKHGIKATAVEGNIYYNYEHRDVYHIDLGIDVVGRTIKDCVGSPPTSKLDKKRWTDISSNEYPYNENLVIDDHQTFIREDPNEGTVIKIKCPPGCYGSNIEQEYNITIFGGVLKYSPFIFEMEMKNHTTYIYSETSYVCAAAIHAGIIEKDIGGLVDVTVRQEYNITNSSTFLSPSPSQNGILSKPIVMWGQVYSVSPSYDGVGVQTISGAPTSLLGDSCGYHDAIPPQEAEFGTPSGIAAFVNVSLDDNNNFIFIADRNNHAIRAISATCAFPCENGGRCIGPDTCNCKDGWEGIDCTRPVCSSPCGSRRVCTGPNQCDCIPGYTGQNCLKPTCVQHCGNGGVCIAPDTCQCAPGWFDSNCTTPVCSQTCGNSGNCTAPDTCSCTEEWAGNDCRIPVCQQTCQNGGWCVAPNTCVCSPQWSGYDCSVAVCHQGFFVPESLLRENNEQQEKGKSRSVSHWLEYRACNFTKWCEETNGFDCAQRDRIFTPAADIYKGVQRDNNVTCITIEIGEDVLSPFQYLLAWNDSLTTHHRYSPKKPYEWISKNRHPWNAFVYPEDGRVQPWSNRVDRQVVYSALYNVTQGVYHCANGGICVAPDTCQCAKGWIGYDCRVPVCNQGYYEPDQTSFVRGTNLQGELTAFERFLGRNNTYRLDPFVGGGEGYSNPEVTIWIERFVNATSLERKTIVKRKGGRYLGESGSFQGGYSCSIRSVTKWEDYRSKFIWEHPNYYSRYMDRKVESDGIEYTHWEGMEWNPTHKKSRKLEIRSSDYVAQNKDVSRVFVYTDEGHRKDGDWSITGTPWSKGSCIVEFNRVCEDKDKAFDLESAPNAGLNIFQYDLLVQDTDRSFRPRIQYSDKKTIAFGRWFQKGGECIDHVVRGCFNNGTCVKPNTCRCATGWKGYDCSIPVCTQNCYHNGNCTHPDTCTCEKGWKGHDCSIAVCAQECNNGGTCVAPDTCKCKQFDSKWRDGRGVPVFQKPDGDPQVTGWTGYDCSTPICVQAELFRHNVNIEYHSTKELVPLGGHGKDGTLECNSVRCPEYNEMVTQNDGRSFQTGCGFDPIDTGCCFDFRLDDDVPYSFKCFRCPVASLEINPHSAECKANHIEEWEFKTLGDIPLSFKTESFEPMLCGSWHNPGGTRKNYYLSKNPHAGQEYSNRNWMSNVTSDRFLCKRHKWEQGDYIDNAELHNEAGMGNDSGLVFGRHVRVNYNNYTLADNFRDIWSEGVVLPGEGIFECYNGGSCIAPDICTCRDGYSGFDCKTPLCRHQQISGLVVGCQNGGICQAKDDCHCIQAISVLWSVHSNAERGLTGWSGTDCSMPMCVQGYYDPFCDIPYAPGGEGCYRCANGGICVAPDTCQCDEGWTGFDCKTPICKATVDPFIREQLMTVDEEKLRIFETDPCGMVGFYDPEIHGGVEHSRGNCTLPNQCTCLCKGTYDAKLCDELGGEYCNIPFQDQLYKYRNVLAPNELFGTRTCYSGYEGLVDENDRFMSCHLAVYEPTYLVKNSVPLITWGSLTFAIGTFIYFYLRRKLHRKHVRAKIERRRTRRASEIAGGARNALLHKMYGDGEKDASKML